MKRITVRYLQEGMPVEADRLVALLATGLERLLMREGQEGSGERLDLSPELSVHTDDHHETTGEPSE